MKDKITHNGAGLVTTEFDIRTIDQYGDVIDVFHSTNKSEAITRAEKFIESGVSAVVVEKSVRKYPAYLFTEPDKYTTIKTFGSRDALEAGSWEDSRLTSI